MKGEKHKSHHYVPQCYLRNFTTNKKSLWVYNKDKTSNNIYQQAISNICCKYDFYSLDGIKNDKLLIEKEYFSNNIEPLFSKTLKSIIDKGTEYLKNKSSEIVLTAEEKYQFAYLLSIQWFRTPYQQHSIATINQDLTSKMINLFKEGLAMETGDDMYRQLDIKEEYDPVLLQAQHGYMNGELLDSYANALSNNYWELFITKEDNVYTSDFPITVKIHEKGVRPEFEGLACFGSELTFPISKNICLTIWDREYFKEKKMIDSCFTSMTERDLGHFNIQRYAYSNEVYCSQNNFEFLSLMNKLTGRQLHVSGIENNK